MKKNMIALILSIVMVVGSIGAVPVIAVETTAEETELVQEESIEEQEVSEQTEEADIGLLTEDASEKEVAQVVEEVDEQSADITAEEGVLSDEQDESADIVFSNKEFGQEDAEISAIIDETLSKERDADELEEYTETADENEAVQLGVVVDSGTCGENATWALTGTDDNLTLTISGSGRMADYSSTNDNAAPWRSIQGNLKTVIVEHGIISISDWAFPGCDVLTSVTIPDSVMSIGDYAFKDCTSLTSITIPESVTSIGDGAFDGCYNLMEIHISNLEAWLSIDDSHSYLSGNLYLNNTILTSAVIPDGMNSVRYNAFSGCSSLTSVTIPESVTSIGESAFHDCSSLTSITIPKGVTSIKIYP